MGQGIGKSERAYFLNDVMTHSAQCNSPAACFVEAISMAANRTSGSTMKPMGRKRKGMIV